MALAGLPSWLDITPETFSNAMRAGASVGTQLRGQDIERANAGDRLRLAYAQLQSQEERASEQAAAKLDLAHAELSARQNQENLMNQFRMQTLKQESDRASDLSDYRDQSLAARGASLAQRTETANAIQDLRERALTLRQQLGESGGAKLHFGTEGEVLRQNQDGTVTQLRPPHTKANVKFDTASGKWFRVTPDGGVEEVAPKAIPEPPPAPEAPGLLSRIGTFFTGGSAAPQAGLTPPQSETPATPATPAKRVSVTGPDGQKGTVPEGTKLPDGWDLNEE